MKYALIDGAGLFIENNTDELRIVTCDHEWGKVIWDIWPTSGDEDVVTYEDHGCQICDMTLDEIEEVQHRTIGHII